MQVGHFTVSYSMPELQQETRNWFVDIVKYPTIVDSPVAIKLK